MTGNSAQTQQQTNESTLAPDERRRYQRVEVSVNGRLMMPNGQEYDCSVMDISLVGIALSSAAPTQIGDTIILYLDGLGRFEGDVRRKTDEGFAIELKLAEAQLSKVNDRIKRLSGVEDSSVPADNKRRFERHPVEDRALDTSSCITLENGESISCRILDMSLSGVLVGTHIRPALGSPVTIGRMSGKVARHAPEGLGIEFDNVPSHPQAISTPFGR